MAIPMRTFGNTLSELQAGTNAAQGLDYQRANAQDVINQARLEAFMRLQGQKFQTQAQQSEQAANRAQRMAELLQQTEANRELAQMDAKSRLEVAKAMAEGRTDPRMFESFADIQALNNENLSKIKYAQQLSEARRAAHAARNKPMAPEENTLGWRNAPYAKRVADADALIKQLDTQAAILGLAPAPDGGYVVPEFTPIPIPNLERSPIPSQGDAVPVAPAPVIPQPQVPAMLQGGNFELVPGGVFDRAINPVPTIPFDTSIPRLRPQGATNYFDFSNGALVPR